MSVQFLIDALRLPADCRVDQRIPKKLLVEQGAPTAADKRAIQSGVEELWWIAALKSTNIGVPEFRDELREYLEIAVLSINLRELAKGPRLIELVHRAIPYPLILCTVQGDQFAVSLAHKRWSQGEAGKVVVDAVLVAELSPSDVTFLAAIDLDRQPSRNLWMLYQGWWEQVEALLAARITGAFSAPPSPEAAAQRRRALAEYDRLQREITLLRAQAQRETQLNRRVELNLQLDRLKSQLIAERDQM